MLESLRAARAQDGAAVAPTERAEAALALDQLNAELRLRAAQKPMKPSDAEPEVNVTTGVFFSDQGAKNSLMACGGYACVVGLQIECILVQAHSQAQSATKSGPGAQPRVF